MMIGNIKNIWWLLAYEKDGTCAWFREELYSYLDAVAAKNESQKKDGEHRYEIIKVK